MNNNQSNNQQQYNPQSTYLSRCDALGGKDDATNLEPSPPTQLNYLNKNIVISRHYSQHFYLIFSKAKVHRYVLLKLNDILTESYTGQQH